MNIYNLAYNSAESQWLMPELIFAETSEAEIITLARENGTIWHGGKESTEHCQWSCTPSSQSLSETSLR